MTEMIKLVHTPEGHLKATTPFVEIPDQKVRLTAPVASTGIYVRKGSVGIITETCTRQNKKYRTQGRAYRQVLWNTGDCDPGSGYTEREYGPTVVFTCNEKYLEPVDD